MYRILKSMLAQFSYFLEKYFGLDSIVWSILFIAGCCSVFMIVIVKVAEITINKSKNKEYNSFSIYVVISIIFSYFINNVISTAYTWDSKLQRVMSNFQYIMSFKANRKVFFNALALPDNSVNQKGLFHIAMYLNNSQWEKVFNNANGSQWYFMKVKKAIDEILKIKNYHLSLGIVYQGIAVLIPAILLIILGIFLIIRKRKFHGILILLSAILCIFYNFGTVIFMAIVMYLGVIFDKWVDISIDNSQNNFENFRSKYMEKGKDTA